MNSSVNCNILLEDINLPAAHSFELISVGCFFLPKKNQQQISSTAKNNKKIDVPFSIKAKTFMFPLRILDWFSCVMYKRSLNLNVKRRVSI